MAGNTVHEFVKFERPLTPYIGMAYVKDFGFYGVWQKLVNIVKYSIKALKCAVVYQNGTSSWVDIKMGIYPTRLEYGRISVSFDYGLVMKRTTRHGELGIKWRFTSKLDDLDFADNVVLIDFGPHAAKNHKNKRVALPTGPAGKVD